MSRSTVRRQSLAMLAIAFLAGGCARCESVGVGGA